MIDSPVEREIPLAVDDAPVLESPGPETTTPAPQAEFASEEIEGLVGEVEDVPDGPPPLSAKEEPIESPLVEVQESSADEPQEVPEIQLGSDATPEEGAETASLGAADETPRIEVNVEAIPGEDKTPEGAEILSDADLFQDPTLEIAHLAAGEQREIVIPVQIAGEGESFQRYKLSLRLRLDPVD
jgi:hypothetical protein